MENMEYKVKLIWDSEARVWYTQTDIPGLCLEAETFDELVEETLLAAPEMLEFNCAYTGPIRLTFEASRVEMTKTL